jgi:hypothetical protein
LTGPATTEYEAIAGRLASRWKSTLKWYWLVDVFTETGYSIKLVNTSKVRQYEGLMYSEDRHGAFCLAQLDDARNPAPLSDEGKDLIKEAARG